MTYLSGALESKPLIEKITFISGRKVEALFLIITINEVLDDSIRFPKNEIAIIVVNYSRDTLMPVRKLAFAEKETTLTSIGIIFQEIG